MRRLVIYWLCLTSGFLLTCGDLVCPAFSDDDAIVIESLRVDPDVDGDILQIQSNKPFAFVTYTLSGPERLVIDPVEPNVESSAPETGRIKGQIIQGWRLRRPVGMGSNTQQLDYLELELSDPAEHLVESTSGKLVLHIRPKGNVLLPATGADPAGNSSVFISGDSSSRVWNLEKAIWFGTNRYRPVRIAREEVDLAQMKIREARRALYPAATMKYSWTDGVASNVSFREYTAGLQLEQPLYYSGRLIEAYRQSLVNLQVAEKRQGKVKTDYGMEVAQEFYQYIGAKSSRAAQEGLVAEAEQFMNQAKARFDKGLLTRLEVLNIEAQFNQSKFQRANAENDVMLGRLKFIQKLGLESDSQLVEAPDRFPTPSLQEIDMEEAIKLALKNKPDIQLNRLLVSFHEYEVQIAEAKTKLKVDLSGFYGSSASAFETEPLDSGNDYFIGFKVSRPWGPHGATASVTKTKTSPRLGQTTRTDSTVWSAEVGILDQLQGLSEIQQAQVNLDKARRDLEDARNSSVQEVQEAVISYRKARLQLGYAQQKIAFREEQVKILKVQASVNEALPSQVLEAIMRLADEKSGQAQALSNYYIALAKLNKAIGLVDHYM